ncbi:hypothetical protein C7446_0193 [Kushneria sinocarnis]|uniref:Uncharacterized protein n=1 Tax=Kushneria sinocarnis TaxID=595502 RepID=A0A420X0K4_9GAMM|nr:hypothetical protein C7446_0193 [Kushneria sinocarnis]
MRLNGVLFILSLAGYVARPGGSSGPLSPAVVTGSDRQERVR